MRIKTNYYYSLVSSQMQNGDREKALFDHNGDYFFARPYGFTSQDVVEWFPHASGHGTTIIIARGEHVSTTHIQEDFETISRLLETADLKDRD